MFDFVRKHTKIMQFLLFLLIFPSFVLFGLEGYSRMREKGAVVATVNGTDILQADLDNAHKVQVDRMRADDGLAFLFQRKRNCGEQIRE